MQDIIIGGYKMFTKKDCCYKTYRKILSDIKETNMYCDYSDVLAENREKFLILRHDIEFSIDRAYELSKIETDEGICSSYFVQITNNAYNTFSTKNISILRKMSDSGHHIGLHYHLPSNSIKEINELKENISFQADILSSMTGITIDRFSFHRPLRELLAAYIEINGLINAYGKHFFVLSDNPTDSLEIKYIADSNHQWKYGYANKDYFSKYNKIQLLIHPLSWTEQGAEHIENFQNIVKEKHDELINTIECNWKLFDQLRGKL